MYTDTIFIFYIIAMFLSLICLALIAVVLVSRKYRSSKLYLATRNFAITVTLTGILYFIFYYREVVHKKFELVMPYRVVDYALCCSLAFLWIILIYRMIEGEKYKKIYVFAWVLFICRIVSSLIIAIGFMGVYYDIDNTNVCYIWSVAEVLFIVLTIGIIVVCAVSGIKESISRLRKQYITFCSILLIIWSVVQCIVSVGLFFGRFGVSAWSLEFPDFTGPVMFLCSLGTFVFVFKEDFSPIFFANESTDAVSKNTENPDWIFDIIAEKHALTIREREVLKLVYDGYTNPDIGSMLYISVNTVKKHTHNLYKKLDVKSRMELIHFINAQKNRK